MDHLLTQKIPRKKVNFIRYITKADDDSISVGETKVIPIYHSKGSALTPFTRRAKNFPFCTFRLDLDDVKIEFVGLTLWRTRV